MHVSNRTRDISLNHENIEKVYFEGYKDEQEKYEEEIQNIKYPRLSIDN